MLLYVKSAKFVLLFFYIPIFILSYILSFKHIWKKKNFVEEFLYLLTFFLLNDLK